MQQRCAIGFSVHTGWAVAVVVAGSRSDPRILQRQRLDILPGGARFVYHAAAEMPIEKARHLIERRTREAQIAAAGEVRRLVEPLSGVAGAAILASKPSPPALLEKVLGSHTLLHTAEGELYRKCLEMALAECGVAVTPVPKPAIDLVWEQTLKRLGKALGPPWTADQKLAMTLAYALLG